MLWLPIIMAAPLVFLGKFVAGIEDDDTRDYFNIAVVAALGPTLLWVAIVLTVFAIRGLHPAHEGYGSSTYVPHPVSITARTLTDLIGGMLLQLALVGLTTKRLLTCTWRQAWVLATIVAVLTAIGRVWGAMLYEGTNATFH